MKKTILTLIIALLGTMCATAQRTNKVHITLIPDHSDALYSVGQKATLKAVVTDCGMALDGAMLHFEVSEDLMAPHRTDSVKLTHGEATIKAGTMKKFGFLRVKATVTHQGHKYTGLSTIGFNAHELTPTCQLPDDFMEFWNAGVEAVRKVDLAPVMTLLPDRCTDKVDVYHISYGNINNSRMYGMLTMPKAPGKYPAILRLPGAGVGEKSGDIAHAAQGAIILELGIHGIPVNLEGSIYADLGRSVLASYHTYNNDNRYAYYYRRVYLGCVKGVDFLLSLPQCNGNIGTLGGSQGGALSTAVSALDSRVKATAIYFPALCDHEGYINRQAGGWPHFFKSEANRSKTKIEAMRYYDTANFARFLKAPVFYAYGYNDLTCAPTTTCATYNIITAPKTLSIGQNTGHWLYPEQNNDMWQWIINQLK